jgi:hypothetical protein
MCEATETCTAKNPFYFLSLKAPIPLQVPDSVAHGKNPDELKLWIWQNCAHQIIPSLSLTTTIDIAALNTTAAHDPSDTNQRDSTATNVNTMEEEEKKDAHIPLHHKKRVRAIQQNGRVQYNRESLLDTIAHVQRQFFQSVSPREIFGGLLDGLLDLMSSEYGFIGEVKYEDGDEENGTMYLQTHAITNIAWNQATRQFYEDNIESGTYLT